MHNHFIVCSCFTVSLLEFVLEHVLVCVSGVSAVERDKTSRKTVNAGESVTLDPGEVKMNGVMMWYYNDEFQTEC